MKNIRSELYKKYYSTFKRGEPREKFGFLHLKLWYNEKYLPLLKNIERNEPVLDIGCGQGFMLRYLESVGFSDLSGIDISQEQVEVAKSKGFNVTCLDVFDYLREREDTFKVILAIDLIEHFNKEEIFELLNLIIKALKQGGIFILQTPNGEGLLPGYVIYGDFTHYTILSPLSLNQILRAVGFENIKVKELGPAFLIHFPLFIIWQVIRFFAMMIKFAEIGRIQTKWTESIICSSQKPKE